MICWSSEVSTESTELGADVTGYSELGMQFSAPNYGGLSNTLVEQVVDWLRISCASKGKALLAG